MENPLLLHLKGRLKVLFLQQMQRLVFKQQRSSPNCEVVGEIHSICGLTSGKHANVASSPGSDVIGWDPRGPVAVHTHPEELGPQQALHHLVAAFPLGLLLQDALQEHLDLPDLNVCWKQIDGLRNTHGSEKLRAEVDTRRAISRLTVQPRLLDRKQHQSTSKHSSVQIEACREAELKTSKQKFLADEPLTAN